MKIDLNLNLVSDFRPLVPVGWIRTFGQQMKPTLSFVIAMALPLATAGASDIKFDESYAASTVAQSSSIFEAKPIQISKVFSLKDGTVVTADELAKLERPSSGTQKVIFAKITYDVEFEVTKTYIGSTKIGHQFSLTWSDLH